jgi:hypothetical protein
VLPRTPKVSPPLENLLHGCTDKFHACIRMKAICSVNANVNCNNSKTLFKSLNQTCKSLLR